MRKFRILFRLIQMKTVLRINFVEYQCSPKNQPPIPILNIGSNYIKT